MDDMETRTAARLAATLRGARQARKLTLRKLAEQAGCSESMLSKIEHGHAQPSLRLLHALAGCLGVKVAALLAEPPMGPVTVHHAGTRLQLPLSTPDARGAAVILERAVPFTEGMLIDANLHIVPPCGGSAGSYAHDAEEVGYVVSGALELTVDGTTYRLTAGSSFHFNSRLPHSYVNRSVEVARVFWVNAFSG